MGGEGGREGGREGGGGGGRGEGEGEGVAKGGRPSSTTAAVKVVKVVPRPLMGAYGAAPFGRARARGAGGVGASGAPAAKRPIFF